MRVLLVVSVLSYLVLDSCHAIGEDCITNANCTTQEKSVCLNTICTCDTLYYYTETYQKCVKYITNYGSICYEDKQCEFFGNNSACEKNTCVCSSGYRWYQGKCQRYSEKGKPCDSESICLDLNDPLAMKCDSGICVCNDIYYDRGEDCRIKSEIYKDCAISGDCFPAENIYGVLDVYSHCELGTCVADTDQNYVSMNTFAYTTITNNQNETDSDVIIYDETCPQGVLSNLTEDECNFCANTLYFHSACICKQGFFLQNETCVAELGMLDETAKYVNDSDCPIKPGKVVEEICYCKDYWFQDDTNRECKKTTLQYTLNCMDNEWCKAMGKYAYCNSTQKCQCINEAVLNETSYYCDLNSDVDLTGICLSDSDCALYETCKDEQCQCTDGFYKTDQSDLCLPRIGYSCEFRDCSHIEDAFCSEEEVCHCSATFVTDGSLCLEPAKNLYEECIIEEQCSQLNHTTCVRNSTESENATTSLCMCSNDYTDIDGICYNVKYPGSLCETQKDCTIILGDSFVCRNMLCQCRTSETLNEDNICVASCAKTWSSHASLAVILGLLLGLTYSIQ